MTVFKYKRRGPNLKISGTLNEKSKIEGIFGTSPFLFIDSSNIHYINSLGVRTWANEIYSYNGKIIYQKCSVPIIEQFNMIPEFMGKNIWVESFYAPYFCEDCLVSNEQLLIIDENFILKEKKILESVFCPECNQKMDEDFFDEDYFLFIQQLSSPPDKAQIKDSLDMSNSDQIESIESKGEIKNRFLDTPPRKPLTVKVEISELNSKNPVLSNYDTFSENISTGGIFIYTSKRYNNGEILKVTFTLPLNDKEIYISAETEVRWHRNLSQRLNKLPGTGLQFLNLSTDIIEKIDQYVKNFEK